MFDDNELYEERMAICRECGLFKETFNGPICNPKKYIDLTDKTTIYDTFGLNRKSGCSCRLEKRTRIPHAHCIAGKW